MAKRIEQNEFRYLQVLQQYIIMYNSATALSYSDSSGNISFLQAGVRTKGVVTTRTGRCGALGTISVPCCCNCFGVAGQYWEPCEALLDELFIVGVFYAVCLSIL